MKRPSRRTVVVAATIAVITGAGIAANTYVASGATSVTGQITGLAGKCIGAAGGRTANGTAIDLYSCVGDATQRWTFPGDGTIRTAGRCMDVAGAGVEDGVAVQLYDCNGTVAQQWKYSSEHYLVNPHAGKCLGLVGSSSADFTVTEIRTCAGGANQKWTVPDGGGDPVTTTAPPAGGTSSGGTSGGQVEPSAFWGDTAGIPAAANVLTFKILNRTNGKYPDGQVYWSFNGQTRSIAEQSTIDVPVATAARMYFFLGSPNGQYSDFIEFNTTPGWIGVNTTRVDGFGLKLALRVRTNGGADSTVGEDYATFAEDRAATFKRFTDEVPAEFKGLAQEQAPYRIPAPGNSAAFRSGGRYEGYFTGYASSLGHNVSSNEVFACSGAVLGNNAALCGALNRHVADQPSSQWSSTGQYYRSAPANFYSKFWHDHAIDHKAYGFPYDDAVDQSSFIAVHDPKYMIAAVGW